MPWEWRLGRAVHLLLALLMAGPTALSAQPPQEHEGYQLRPTQVVVETPAHWRSWEAAEGVRVVEANGLVRPRLLRRDINAALNAWGFINISGKDTTSGGISQVGVLADTLDAPFIMDGDLTTWWEPNPEFLELAWVVMDLGRLVVARRIHLKFAAEGMGDPFLKFRVLVSDGYSDFGQNRRREFVRVGQVATPNKDRREFTFDIEPFRPVPGGVVGEPVQYIRIDMLGTDGPRAAEVSREVYYRLGPDDRGAVDFFRQTVAGREIPVIEEAYQLLPEAERGPVRYYRREHPRLAEVEVEALGDNIVTLTQRPLFAVGDFFDDLARRFITDGLMTPYSLRVYDPFRDREQIVVDLGGKFWLERLRLISTHNPMTSYQLRTSDGSLEPNGEKAWYSFEERVNAERFLQVEERFPTRPVRFIELRRLDLLGDGGTGGVLSEIQAYGEGYVAEATMTSPLVKLGRRLVVTGLEWEGSAPVGTQVLVRTRSGDGITPVVHYFNRADREVNQAMYERLKEENRGPIRIDEFPGPDWSTWSEPYPAAGPFLSPSPRLMAMAQVTLQSSEPLRCASIRRLILHLAPPLVTEVVAEIAPTRNIAPGRDREFQLYIQPLLETRDPGFDRLRIHSSSSAPLHLLSARAGTDIDLRFGTAQQLWPGPAQVEPLANGGIELVLPEGHDLGKLLVLTLRASVYLPSTAFEVDVVLADRAQMVDAGDASSLVPSSSLVVVADLGGVPLLAPLRVEPPVFTPNSDGVNDDTGVRLTVYHVEGHHRLDIGVYDLSGRRVRDLSFESEHPSGEHRIVWNGRDGAGQLLPPGTYLVRVHLPTDAGASHTTAVRPVSLVY